MPVAVVRTPEEGELLERAKEIMQDSYPEAESVRFRRIVTYLRKDGAL